LNSSSWTETAADPRRSSLPDRGAARRPLLAHDRGRCRASPSRSSWRRRPCSSGRPPLRVQLSRRFRMKKSPSRRALGLRDPARTRLTSPEARRRPASRRSRRRRSHFFFCSSVPDRMSGRSRARHGVATPTRADRGELLDDRCGGSGHRSPAPVLLADQTLPSSPCGPASITDRGTPGLPGPARRAIGAMYSWRRRAPSRAIRVFLDRSSSIRCTAWKMCGSSVPAGSAETARSILRRSSVNWIPGTPCPVPRHPLEPAPPVAAGRSGSRAIAARAATAVPPRWDTEELARMATRHRRRKALEKEFEEEEKRSARGPRSRRGPGTPCEKTGCPRWFVPGLAWAEGAFLVPPPRPLVSSRGWEESRTRRPAAGRGRSPSGPS